MKHTKRVAQPLTAGHTSGPWKVVQETGVETLKGVIHCDNSKQARLIAAAPELLASLQAMVWVAEYYVKPGTDGFELLKDAKRIIAKAEGQESTDEKRIRELENEGLTRSDAQAVFEAEQMNESEE